MNFYGFSSAGLTAKVIDRTKTMADVYGAFFDFSVMLKAKVEIFLSDSAIARLSHVAFLHKYQSLSHHHLKLF